MIKHGRSKSGGMYEAWRTMRRRCEKEWSPDYPDYGGRGIKVCERWQKFENFLADMGERPVGMSIDRIDNDSDYEPSNCRWATLEQQARNRRANVNVTYNGETLCLLDWSRKLGIPYTRVTKRTSQLGWTPLEALGLLSRS